MQVLFINIFSSVNSGSIGITLLSNHSLQNSFNFFLIHADFLFQLKENNFFSPRKLFGWFSNNFKPCWFVKKQGCQAKVKSLEFFSWKCPAYFQIILWRYSLGKPSFRFFQAVLIGKKHCFSENFQNLPLWMYLVDFQIIL